MKKVIDDEQRQTITQALDTLQKFDPKSVASTRSLVRQFLNPAKTHLHDLTETCLDHNLTLWESEFGKNDQALTAVNKLRTSVLGQETF